MPDIRHYRKILYLCPPYLFTDLALIFPQYFQPAYVYVCLTGFVPAALALNNAYSCYVVYWLYELL